MPMSLKNGSLYVTAHGGLVDPDSLLATVTTTTTVTTTFCSFVAGEKKTDKAERQANRHTDAPLREIVNGCHPTSVRRGRL